jgi:hypothetical protein
MVCFQTKNPYLGKFWRVLEWKILVYFMTIFDRILMLLEIFNGLLVYFVRHLVYFPPFWYFVQRKIWQPRSPAFSVHTSHPPFFCLRPFLTFRGH